MGSSTVTVITTAISFLMCVIGVLTFISGRLSKAEKDGRLAEKLDTCVKGIDEIKVTLTAQQNAQNRQNVTLENHEQRFIALETRVQSLEQKGGKP